MIIRGKFLCEEHRDYGGLGWRPMWQPTFDPYQGLAVAHDLLEHKRRGSGAENEFMAFGAMWRIRGQTGYMQRNGNRFPPHHHMAADFPDIFRRIGEFQTLNDPGRTRPLESVTEGAFEAAVDEGFALVETECEGELDHLLSDENKRRVTGWLRLGARWADRRYRNYDFHDIAYMIFQQIENKADKLLRIAEEGDVLTVEADLDCNTVKAHSNQFRYE